MMTRPPPPPTYISYFPLTREESKLNQRVEHGKEESKGKGNQTDRIGTGKASEEVVVLFGEKNGAELIDRKLIELPATRIWGR